MNREKIQAIEDPELRYAVEHSRDEEPYPAVFPEDYGMDYHSEEYPTYYPVAYNNPRTITLDITSYRGMCGGAVHFYGKIKIDGIHVMENRDGRIIGHGGYVPRSMRETLPKDVLAAYNMSYEIELVRPVTRAMIDEDEDRWHGYIPGYSSTDAFDTVDEIIELGKKVVKARVPWFNVDDLKIEHNYCDVDVRKYR